MKFDLPPNKNEDKPERRSPERLLSLCTEPENIPGGLSRLMLEISEQFETWTEEQKTQLFNVVKERIENLFQLFPEKWEKSIDILQGVSLKIVSIYKNIIEGNQLCLQQTEEMVKYGGLTLARIAEYKNEREKIEKAKYTKFEDFQSDMLSFCNICMSIGNMIDELADKQKTLLLLLASSENHSPVATKKLKKEEGIQTGNREQKDDDDIEIKILFDDLEKINTVEGALNMFQKAYFRLEREGRYISKNETALKSLKRAALVKMRQVSDLPIEAIQSLERGWEPSLRKEDKLYTQKCAEYKRCLDLFRKIVDPQNRRYDISGEMS